MEADKGKYYFYYTVNGEKEVFLGRGLTAGLSTEGTVPMSFTGTYLALFAENGDARFKNFSIKYKKEVFLGRGLTAGLSTEGTVPMSFTGTYLALFAENGDARFKNFSIKYKN